MMTLQCHPVGVDPTSFVWLKNSKAIPGETGRTFTLHILTSDDTGDYLCGDSNPDIPRLIHHVEVLWTVPRPVISKDKPPVSGRPFQVDCIIEANYPITGSVVYTWYQGSAEIKGQAGPKLSFDNLTEADADKYTCTARDGPPDTTSPPSQAFHLIPLVAPQVHIEPSSVIKGISGENLTLTCKVTHAVPKVPDNGYSWSFVPSHRGPMLPLPETTRTLMLGPLTRTSSGQYVCLAKNDQEVEDLVLAGQAFVTMEVAYLENLSTTPDLTVNESDPVILTCSVDSYPTAHIAWTVDGQEIRRVVDNLDHYFISSASCSSSANYTCYATNSDIPGLEKKGTTALIVNCRQEESKKMIRGPNIIQADIAAPFDFPLPKQDSVLVVHPSGHVIITVHSNCSFLVASAFESRCLHPHCDPASHHLTFTLTRVTDKDQGHYSCLDEKQRKSVAYCNQTLIKKEQSVEDSHPQDSVGPVVGWIALVGTFLGGVVLIIMLRRRYMGRSPLSSNVQPYEGSHKLEKLYKKGKIYIFSKYVVPENQSDDSANESSSFLGEARVQVQEEAAYIVTNLIRYTLNKVLEADDLPSFVLHNTRLSKEDIILILSRKIGVVVMLVVDIDDENNLESLENATKLLLEARRVVEEKVKGLIKPRMIAAVIALPRLPDTADVSPLRRKVKILDSNRDVEMLLGGEKERFKRWAEQLSQRPALDVWDCSQEKVDSPDTAFEEAASQFLTLTGGDHPSKSPMCSTIGESWLLTPYQMNVRDSKARFLHIWGPHGSGKTMLLIHRAREWLSHGKTVVIAVGRDIYDVLLSYIADTVLREQEQETKKKLRVCRSHTALQESVEELKRLYPNAEICIIVHTVRHTDMLKYMLMVAESKQAYAVWSVYQDNLHAISKDLFKRARTLGWGNTNLSLSTRCSENIVQLLNMLEGSRKFASCTATPVRDFTQWEVLDHCGDQGHTSDLYNCIQCRERMTRIVSSQGRKLKWSDWIALCSGNLNADTDMEDLCTFLHCLGVPASLSAYNDIAPSPSRRLDPSIAAPSPEESKGWKRVVDGVDAKGKPTVHLLPARDLIILEKENVLLVHSDERDNDPRQQSQDKRGQRLEEHRHQWIQGVSRSKGQVILLLLTPSPARSLLDLPEVALP